MGGNNVKLLKKNDLESHDMYEFCYAKAYPENWNEDSLFLIDEEFILLMPYLDKVFSQYHYYGPQKITLHEWENVKKIALSKENQKECIITFFIQIDDWINNDVNKNDYFWILGI